MKKKSTYLALLFFLGLGTMLSLQLYGQIPINNVGTVTVPSVSNGTVSQSMVSYSNSINGVIANTSYNVNYTNATNRQIVDFIDNGKTYVRFAFYDTIIIRRAANSYETTNGNKQFIYCEGPTTVDNLTYTMQFPVAYPQTTNQKFMERTMKDGFINRGSDNVFNNTSSDYTYNNIERIDFVSKVGVASYNTGLAGFVITERGGNDGFKIAAITGIDINGNPTSFASAISVSTASYGNSIASFSSYVMRKDVADANLKPFSYVGAQSIKGIFMRFSDLGIAVGQRVYGYALMAPDVTATTSAQLLDYTNSTYYPTNTSNSIGGLDLASAPGIFHSDFILSATSIKVRINENNCTSSIFWTDDNSSEAKEYQIEKSINGNKFEVYQTVAFQTNRVHYSISGIKGPAYYRIKIIKLSGEVNYSFPVYINSGNCDDSKQAIYPNPTTSHIMVPLKGLNGEKHIYIYNSASVLVGTWLADSNTTTFTIGTQSFAVGNYYVKVVNANQEIIMHQFLKL